MIIVIVVWCGCCLVQPTEEKIWHRKRHSKNNETVAVHNDICLEWTELMPYIYSTHGIHGAYKKQQNGSLQHIQLHHNHWTTNQQCQPSLRHIFWLTVQYIWVTAGYNNTLHYTVHMNTVNNLCTTQSTATSLLRLSSHGRVCVLRSQQLRRCCGCHRTVDSLCTTQSTATSLLQLSSLYPAAIS